MIQQSEASDFQRLHGVPMTKLEKKHIEILSVCLFGCVLRLIAAGGDL